MQRIIKGLLQNKLIPSLDDILVDYSYISDHEDVIVLVTLNYYLTSFLLI